MGTETAIRTVDQEIARSAEALVQIGVDSPLKLDLLAALEHGGRTYEGAPALAARCGMSPRDVVAILDDLARAELVECRRFYNIPEYASSRSSATRERLRGLLGGTPGDLRRLRRALLARLG